MRLLEAAGAKVVLADIDQSTAEKLTASLTDVGYEAIFVHTDVSAAQVFC